MAEHSQFAHQEVSENLPLYAVGALPPQTCEELRQHLDDCPACRRELEEFRAGAAMLALSAGGPAAPQRSRQRLLAAIAQDKDEPLVEPQTISALPRPWWSLAPLFASLVLAIFALLLWRENAQLKRTNEALQQQNTHAREVAEIWNAPDAQHVTLVSGGAHPVPQIKVIYIVRTQRMLLVGSNLPALPPNKTYQLWILPPHGAPMPAATFKPNRHGNTMTMPPHPLPTAGIEAKGFAVTVEPDGGSSTPTSPIVLEQPDASAGG